MGTVRMINVGGPARRDNRSNEWNLIKFEGARSKGLGPGRRIQTGRARSHLGRRSVLGKGSHLQPAVDCQPRQQLVDLALDGVQRDLQPAGDLLAAQTLDHQIGDSTFPIGELPDLQRPGLAPPRSVPMELAKERTGQFRGQHPNVPGHRVDGAEEPIEGRVLHDEP
jgi:hypothetical protein